MKSMPIKQTNFNITDYKNDEVTKLPKIKSLRKDFEDFIFPEKDIKSICLDVGCGNGRLNQMLKDHFKTIVCIDPIVEPIEKYMYKNCKYFKKDFFDFQYKENFDAIFFWGSFNILYEYYSYLPIKRALSMLKPHGKIVIMCESFQTYMFDYRLNLTGHKTNDTKVYIITK